MKTIFCRTDTCDQLRMTGLLFEPEAGSKIGILHLHGRAGGFYANAFLDAMAEIYTAPGFGFLTVNLRGHDQIADFRIGNTDQIKRIGQAFDVFEECVFDIGAWLDFFRSRGYEKIILQGYSQGGGKAVYFLNEKPQTDVIALVLMSPADAAGLLKKYDPRNFEKDLALANDMVAQGRGNELLLRPIRGTYYVSANTFIDEFGDPTKANIFPIFENGGFGKLENIKIPTLALYGSKENLCINSPKQDLEIIAPHLKNPKSKTSVIKGADHTYHNREIQVASLIANWLKEIL
ncbi:MAG: alpha/beta fold hydrolase [Minisyncoccales bacterium]